MLWVNTCAGLTPVHCQRVLPFSLAPSTKFWPHMPFSTVRLECGPAHGRHRTAAELQVQHLSPSCPTKCLEQHCLALLQTQHCPARAPALLMVCNSFSPTRGVCCFRILHVRFREHSCASLCIYCTCPKSCCLLK